MYKGMLIVVLGLAMNAAAADSLILQSDKLSAFNNFLSGATVKLREGFNTIEFSTFHYELREGEKVENGCRFKNSLSREGNSQVIQRAIAQDMQACKRLYLIGVPKYEIIDDPEEGFIQNIDKSSGVSTSREYELVDGCDSVVTRYTDGRQSLMQVIRDLFGFDGIEIAEATSWARYYGNPSSRDHCTLTIGNRGMTMQGFSSFSDGGYGWDNEYENFLCPQDAPGCFKVCSGIYNQNAYSGITAKITNHESLPWVFDCSEGAAIEFHEVSVESQSVDEDWKHTVDVTVTGPFEGCTENLFDDTVTGTLCD